MCIRDRLTERQKKSFDWPALRGYSYGNLMRVLESPALQCVTGPVGEFGWDGWTSPYMEPVSYTHLRSWRRLSCPG